MKKGNHKVVIAFMLTPGIHVGITSWVRASLAGIFARPKAHLQHVLLPCCKGMGFYVSCEDFLNFLSGRMNFPFGWLFSIRNSFFKLG